MSRDPLPQHEAETSRRPPERADAVAGERAAPVERVAAGMGNRGFTQLVARMGAGEGILSGGLVHPDVEAAIAASRGRGAPLDGGVAAPLERAYGAPLGDVRVHTGAQAGALARAVSARAFTVGRDIFFAPGEYRPGTSEGAALIAHEAAHVVQQRGAPAGGPLAVSEPGDATEVEAEGMARDAGH
jgi:hypothetical protein